MDLQTTFYTLGIIYFVLMILVTIFFTVLAIYLARKFERLQHDIKDRVKSIVTPTSIIGLGGLVFRGLVGWIRSKRR